MSTRPFWWWASSFVTEMSLNWSWLYYIKRTVGANEVMEVKLLIKVSWFYFLPFFKLIFNEYWNFNLNKWNKENYNNNNNNNRLINGLIEVICILKSTDGWSIIVNWNLAWCCKFNPGVHVYFHSPGLSWYWVYRILCRVNYFSLIVQVVNLTCKKRKKNQSSIVNETGNWFAFVVTCIYGSPAKMSQELTFQFSTKRPLFTTIRNTEVHKIVTNS